MYQRILDFWFHELDPAMWWKKDRDLDTAIGNRFGSLHQQATQGELFYWRKTAQGSLAEVIVLDQFSRNIYRDLPQSFANDPLALVLAQTAIDKGFDKALSQIERSFLYLPFMHSESATIQSEAIKLYTELSDAVKLDFAFKHKAIIDRFGRYPHRNEILGRVSTTEEIKFLKQPNSGF